MKEYITPVHLEPDEVERYEYSMAHPVRGTIRENWSDAREMMSQAIGGFPIQLSETLNSVWDLTKHAGFLLVCMPFMVVAILYEVVKGRDYIHATWQDLSDRRERRWP